MRCSHSRSFGSKRIKHLKKRRREEERDVIIMRCGRRAQALRKRCTVNERDGVGVWEPSRPEQTCQKGRRDCELAAQPCKIPRTDGRF